MEGGSISLLGAFFASNDDRPYEVSTELLRVVDPHTHLRRLRLRTRQMLAPARGQQRLLQELAIAWRHTSQREFIASIVGFGSVINWCRDHDIQLESLHEFTPNLPQQDELAAAIAHEHATYGELQHQAFLAMLTRARLRAPETVVCQRALEA